MKTVGGYSVFGEKLGLNSGIVKMMDNLSQALSEADGRIMLGGGNPARLDEVADMVEEVVASELQRKGAFFDVICNYSSPKGDFETAKIVADYLRNECQWRVTADNLFFCNGSQAGLFMVFNMLAGRRQDGGYGKVMLPFVPEYIGYEDVFVDGSCFSSIRPRIQITGEQSFRYVVDLGSIKPQDEVSCIAISSPSNPTGKCWEPRDLEWINRFSKENGYPLVYDNAYGWPFPNVQFNQSAFEWDDNMIVSMSLSKIGMPGLRTGVLVANEEIIERLRCISAVSQLSPNTVGMYVLKKLIQSGILSKIAKSVVAPFYRERAKRITALLKEGLKDYPVRIHESGGTMFIWLWMENIPIKSEDLYEALKNKGVLTLSGHHFFIGQKDTAWAHKDECLRLTFTQPMEKVEKGVEIVVREIKRAFDDLKASTNTDRTRNAGAR